jgi:predicted enzyme related to lactoylglutathione lyase
MDVIDKVTMLSVAVSDMKKSKEFYVDSLGCKLLKDYGQGDMHWVSIELPGGAPTLTLTTNNENMQPGTLKLYISTKDINAANQKLAANGAQDITDDLYGPGSGVKWFSINDPDGNQLIIAEATNQ